MQYLQLRILKRCYMMKIYLLRTISIYSETTNKFESLVYVELELLFLIIIYIVIMFYDTMKHMSKRIFILFTLIFFAYEYARETI